MTITSSNLTRAAGAAAAVAGAIFIGVQIDRPPADSFLTDTNEWVIRCCAKAVMCALAIAGITGIYLRQVRQMRVLGLVGFLLFAAGYLLLFATEVMAVFFLPALTDTAPTLVNDIIIASAGGTRHRRHRPHADHVQPHRRWLHARWPDLRHRALPRQRARPVGRRAPRGERRRRRRPRRTAGVVRPAHGHPRRCCPHRPRHLFAWSFRADAVLQTAGPLWRQQDNQATSSAGRDMGAAPETSSSPRKLERGSGGGRRIWKMSSRAGPVRHPSRSGEGLSCLHPQAKSELAATN